MIRSYFVPDFAHDVERIGRHAREAMIGRTHDKSCAVRDLTEFADDKLVAEDRIIEKNLRFFKVLRMFRAVVVGIVAYKNIGCRYDIFQKNGCFVLVWKNNIRIRIFRLGHGLLPSRSSFQ